MKKLFFLPVICAILFSCKKDKKSDCATDVSHISGAYKFTAYTYQATPTSPEQDYFNIIFPDACERDDILTFNSAGTWTMTDAGMVCTPRGDDNGTWSLTGNTLNIDGDALTVQSFDCKTLVLANNNVMASGDKMKITLTKQ